MEVKTVTSKGSLIKHNHIKCDEGKTLQSRQGFQSKLPDSIVGVNLYIYFEFKNAPRISSTSACIQILWYFRLGESQIHFEAVKT